MSTQLLPEDVPLSIQAGCTLPMHPLWRATVLLVGAGACLVVAQFAADAVRARLGSPLAGQAALALAAGALALATPTLWTWLRDNLRDCRWYNAFKDKFRDEMTRAGMTKDVAIAEALEKVQYERRLAAMRTRGRSRTVLRFG
jgi:hypothetical protein